MKKIIMLAVSFVFMGAVNSLAEPVQQYAWQLGTEISHISYKEPNVMDEKGAMYGVLTSFTYRNNLEMLRAEGRFSYGQVDYTSTSSGTMDGIDDYMLEFRGLGGYDFKIFETSTLTTYAGIGYRYLNDNMSKRTTTKNAAGYEREIGYTYSPIGIETDTPLENGWSAGSTLEFDYFWTGTVDSNMGNITGYFDISNDLDKGYGWRASIRLRNKGKDIDFLIESFIRAWRIEESNSTKDAGGTTWVEPKNNSTEYGIKLAVMF